MTWYQDIVSFTKNIDAFIQNIIAITQDCALYPRVHGSKLFVNVWLKKSRTTNRTRIVVSVKFWLCSHKTKKVYNSQCYYWAVLKNDINHWRKIPSLCEAFASNFGQWMLMANIYPIVCFAKPTNVYVTCI